jgi:hypothetical protein
MACASDPACAALAACPAFQVTADGAAPACDVDAGAGAVKEFEAFQSCLMQSCSSSCGSCHGTGSSCSAHGDSTSCSKAGCAWSGQCTGVSQSCFSFLSSSTCSVQHGCSYNSSTNTCSGIAESCDLISDEALCAAQQGCGWQASCTGITGISCTQFTDQASCLGAGCSWN